MGRESSRAGARRGRVGVKSAVFNAYRCLVQRVLLFIFSFKKPYCGTKWPASACLPVQGSRPSGLPEWGGAPVGWFVGAGKPAPSIMGISDVNFPKGGGLPKGFSTLALLTFGSRWIFVVVVGCPGLYRISSSFPCLHPLMWQMEYLQVTDIPWQAKTTPG